MAPEPPPARAPRLPDRGRRQAIAMSQGALLGGLVLQRVDSASPVEAGYAVAVFVVFLAANALNFLMIAGHARLLRGGSLAQMFRQVYVPVLPWEVASAAMTAMAVYGFEV